VVYSCASEAKTVDGTGSPDLTATSLKKRKNDIGIRGLSVLPWNSAVNNRAFFVESSASPVRSV
jgi:hypothetical protein